MPAFKVRRKLLAMNGMDVRTGASLVGGIDVGGATDFTDFTASGFQTMGGTARVYREFYIPAEDFLVSGCAAQGNEGPWFIPGSAIAGSHGFETGDLTGTCGPVFLSTSAASATVVALKAACAITASMWYAQATFPVPLDRATSGSITLRPVWTVASDMGTSGSVTAIKGALAYISSSAAIAEVASAGACPAYNYTASNVLHETALSDIPSFSAGDVLGVLTIGTDPTDGDDTMGASDVRILGVKVRYLSDRLGTQSS